MRPQLELLTRVLGVLNPSFPPDAMLQRVFEIIGPELGCDAYFLCCSPLCIWRRQRAPTMTYCNLNFSQEQIQRLERVCLEETSLRNKINQAGELAEVYAAWKELGFASVIYSELASTETRFGGLHWASRNEIVFHESERHLVQAIANHFAIALDLSVRLHAENALAQRQMELAHSGRLQTLGLMSTTLSHELNQPLTAISNYASACLELANNSQTILPKPYLEFLEKITLQSQRSSKILKQLRDYARQRHPDKSLCKIETIIHESIALMQYQLRHTQIEVVCDIDPHLPDFDGDALQIQQVFVNLLNNAAEAMLAAAVSIRTVFVHAHVENRTLLIELYDSGPGVPRPLRTRVFEPFFSSKANGTGIGLGICRDIVTSHGGLLTLEEDTDCESVFRIQLPLDPVPMVTEADF